jgi:DNA polymerase gamma 1
MKNPENAVSPILGNRITQCLRTHDFAPSRQNWYIQTSGCDLRDILVCTMAALMPEISLALYIHDEPRYLVPEDLDTKALSTLQKAHETAISMMADAFSLEGLPDSFLYFDSLESDYCWRKDANAGSVTPTQTVPLKPGKTIKRKG